jgi:hypothetical protein
MRWHHHPCALAAMDTRIVIVVVLFAVAYALFPHECWEQRRQRRRQELESNTTGVVIVVHESGKHMLPTAGGIKQ